MWTRTAVVLVSLFLFVPPVSGEEVPAPRPGAEHAVPLYGELLRVFDAPKDPFAPGHRGVDIAAPTGSPVHASAAGVVSFAGSVAGNLTVTVDHGAGLLTTYSFLGETRVARGAPVDPGVVVGTVGRGHVGSGLPSHVHLSARRDGFYFDPLELYVGVGYADLLSLVA
jgi:murein DD-endopeptidase MepM/ murein hydrolase activator NlpD